MLQSPIPKRVRVLVLGGGIHGVGVLHDLVSRGWKDVHLVEKERLASGTSSKSTKLIHGGLRYLEKITQFRMVSESLHERNFLLRTLPHLVQPIEFVFPILKKNIIGSLLTRTGLTIYDFLSGKSNIAHHRVLSLKEAKEKTALLNFEKFSQFFSFWDAQVDDLALVWSVAHSAVSLGAGVTEECQVVDLKQDADGWTVDVVMKNGDHHSVSALYVVNCLGPWANQFLEKSQIAPKIRGINNRGTHILIKDRGLKAGLFLTSPVDKRVIFMIPWKGMTLLGTTEAAHEGDPDQVRPLEKDINYILASCNYYLNEPILKQDIQCSFAGLRWLAESTSRTLSGVSRESVLTEHASERGFLLTIYGGKLTSYRALSEKVGDRIMKHFGEHSPSRTLDKNFWFSMQNEKVPDLFERFQSRF